MITITKGRAATVEAQILTDGIPVPIDAQAEVSARLYDILDHTPLTLDVDCEAGSAWAQGRVAIAFDQLAVDALPVGVVMLVVSGPFGVRRFEIRVEGALDLQRSALFVRDFVINQIRADNLMAAAQPHLSDGGFSDDHIWEKVLSAEAWAARELRVPLRATRFFPGQPTQEQIEALNGMPWAIDPGYDYEQDMFFPDKWGMIKLNNRPLISIESVDFDFPTMGDAFFKMPIEWLRTYDKYGHVQFVPSTPALFSTAGTFVMRALTGYRVVPMMVKITYTAGIENAARDFPDLLDVVKRTAVLRAIEDGFPKESGSISADGLSQSMSIDMSQYREVVNTLLHGEKGTNGGLMGALHGVRSVVMGG